VRNSLDESTRKSQITTADCYKPPMDSALAPLTPTQWLICAVACLGFAFDQYESVMSALIVRPVLTTLGNMRAGTPEFNLWVGLFFFVPTAAGGIFGLLGGYLTDLLGRRRVLVWSILLYGFSACAASLAPSLTLLLILRCTTLIGVCVEFVAAVAWLAELFPNPKQRESVLGYSQASLAVGGVMVSGAYYFAVTYADRLPVFHGGHEPWRYTLLSGLIPAIPLMIVRPFLPESPVWREMKSKGTLKRPSLAEPFQRGLRKTTLLAIVMVACTTALAEGALKHMPRVVPGLATVRVLSPQQMEQTVSTVYLVQELGSVTGRLVFAFLVIRIVSRRRLLRVFLGPALVLFPWLFFYAATRSLALLMIGVFCAQALFNGMYGFWGNYLPRAYPTHLRGTGESFAMNIGGRLIGVSAAVVTTQLSNVLPGASVAARLVKSSGATATFVLIVALIASFWLREPEGDQLPE
jgi:predicted MFS family arabinose efflux permease